MSQLPLRFTKTKKGGLPGAIFPRGTEGAENSGLFDVLGGE